MGLAMAVVLPMHSLLHGRSKLRKQIRGYLSAFFQHLLVVLNYFEHFHILAGFAFDFTGSHDLIEEERIHLAPKSIIRTVASEVA